MNFKSSILKLSILIMLVLVLLPVIAAEDSSEAFFVEYNDESDEVVVEESDTIDEIDLTQEVVSLDSEVQEVIEEPELKDELSVQNQPVEIEENNDAINTIEEQIDCSVVETPDIIDENNKKEDEDSNLYSDIENKIEIDTESIDNINYNDIGENVDCELTIENISIKNQGFIFVSEEFDNNNVNLIFTNDLFIETANYETHSFKRSLIKFLELKNNLLINQKVSFIFADNIMCNVDCDVIICADKLANDFVFSIDNSVVGGENLILFVITSFCLDFSPCFDAFFCCDFFGGDFY